MKTTLIIFSCLVVVDLYAQSRPYAPGVIQISPAAAAQQRNANTNRSASAAAASIGGTAVVVANEVISPDDPLATHKTLRAQYRQQIATLQSQIEYLDKLINDTSTPPATRPSGTASSTTSTAQTRNQTSLPATGAALKINEARSTYSRVDIPGSVAVQRVQNGNSSTLVCPTGYMYHNPDGGILKGNETCVPVPQTASTSTVTP